MAAQGKGVLQRVEDLEGQVQSLQYSLKITNDSVRRLLSVFTGMVDVMGGEKLDAQIAEAIKVRQEAAKKRATDAAKKQIEQLLKAGQLKEVPAITKETIVTFAEYGVETTPPTEAGKEPEKKRGAVRDEFAQLPAAQFSPDVIKDLEGKGPGFVFRKGDVEIEIIAVYEMVPVDLKKQIDDAKAADSEPAEAPPPETKPEEVVAQQDQAADENAAAASEAQLGTPAPATEEPK